MERNELYTKIEFFKNRNIAVHVSKNDGRFHNGFVLEIDKEFFVIDDEVTGEIPIFFSEIKFIEPRQPKVSKEFQ